MASRTSPQICGRSLRLRRLARGWSARALRERLIGAGLDVALTSIYDWERGRRQPSAVAARELAHALGCAQSALYREPPL
jgi:transcriptional regulator with XRE-family HTH domain